MNSHKLTITLLLFFLLVGCSSPTASSTLATPTIQPSLEVTNSSVSSTSTVIAIPSKTEIAEPNFPEGCIHLAETALDPTILNGLLVVEDNDINNYFLDPKTSQLLGIGEKLQSPSFDTYVNIISPNKKFMQADSAGHDYLIIRTVDNIIQTYVPKEDWNRGRWLDNEHIFYQNWLEPHDIVIYNPFTGEQKNMKLNLPNPYIVVDGGGVASWVKADIDPSLMRVLYNDKASRLVLWDLETQKEVAFLPAPTDLEVGTWSPDGKEFASPSPSRTSDVAVANELFAIDMEGTVRKLTNFNEKYPFGSVDAFPAWSPDGRYIGFWLRVNPNLKDQWLAITDTTTLETQIYCVSTNALGHRIVWSPDGQQVIVNRVLPGEEMKPTLVDLTHKTQAVLDTKGLWVENWMAP